MSETDIPNPPADATDREKELWKELINRMHALDTGVRESVTENATQYSEGDVVDTPQGVGVVVEARTESFEGKNGEVDASSNSPTYVIGLKDSRVGVGFYKASELSEGEIETDVENPVDDAKSVANNTVHNVKRALGLVENDWTMPESWRESDTPARVILLDAWSSMGGQFDCGGSCCMGELKDEELCASMKDAALGGWTGWRKGG
jgi:hypothetical protein